MRREFIFHPFSSKFKFLFIYENSKATKIMKMQLKMLLYLDERRIINNMKNICIDFLEKLNEESICKFPPLQYILHLDVMDVLDYSAELGDFLLGEPLMWQRLSTEIFYACLKSIYNTNLIRISQVIVKIRFSSSPAFLFNSQLQSFNNIAAYTGLLVDISKPSNYVYYTVWSCPEECEENEVILHQATKNPPKCFVCRSTLYENKALRRYCDQVTAIFMLEGMFCKRFTIMDDLIPILKLGSRYNIHAVTLKNVTSIWSVEENLYFPLPLSSPICPDIDELYSKCEGVPWKFICCLAISIGSNTRPLNSFMNAKINLLMSVSSVKAYAVNGSSIIHFLASGYDTGYVEKLMVHAAKLTVRHVFLGTSNTFVTTALLAASSGVCIMGLPLQAYSQKCRHSIVTAIETGEIIHETSSVKLRCAVWAHGIDVKKMVLRNINSVFQNMCRGDYGEYDDQLSEFILQQAIEPEKMHEDEQILKSVSFYLDTVAGIKVSINIEAENLLRNYFLAARKERPMYVTSGSMNALVLMCITSARICRRSVANITDAVFAIWLHVSGNPDPRFVPEEYLDIPPDLDKLNAVFDKFQEWLENFYGCLIQKA